MRLVPRSTRRQEWKEYSRLSCVVAIIGAPLLPVLIFRSFYPAEQLDRVFVGLADCADADYYGLSQRASSWTRDMFLVYLCAFTVPLLA